MTVILGFGEYTIHFILAGFSSKNIAKGTTDPRVEFSLPKWLFFWRLYHKLKHQSWSNFIFRISTKHLNQTSATRVNFKLKILTKLSFKISTIWFNFITFTKHQQQNNVCLLSQSGLGFSTALLWGRPPSAPPSLCGFVTYIKDTFCKKIGPVLYTAGFKTIYSQLYRVTTAN